MTRVIVTDNTRGHSSEIDEGFFGRQIQDRSVIDRFWHMRMEGLGEAEEASLLAATADQDWLAEFEPEVLDRLFKALARLGADSRVAAQAQSDRSPRLHRSRSGGDAGGHGDRQPHSRDEGVTRQNGPQERHGLCAQGNVRLTIVGRTFSSTPRGCFIPLGDGRLLIHLRDDRHETQS